MVRFQELLREPKIAYFSMEIGVLNDMPTYSGGLGVLAGDTIRSAADLKIPFIAVTLLSRKGFFNQDIDESGRQLESPVSWEPSRFMTLLSEKVKIGIEGRDVYVQSWLYIVDSLTGGAGALFFFFIDNPGKAPVCREITSHLYGGDNKYRLKQEIVLGIGGVRMGEAPCFL